MIPPTWMQRDQICTSTQSRLYANSPRELRTPNVFDYLTTETANMELQQILRTVLAEHEDPGASGSTLETLQADVEARLSDISTVSRPKVVTIVDSRETDSFKVPAYTESSEQLSIVSFRCMLQDTGYPPEVYLPANENATSQDGAIDMSQLRERWVGWAVE